jgi:hypothetical protein
VILVLLVGSALRRNELAGLEGKGRGIRTVAIPIWVKQGINPWMTATGIEEGQLLRSISKSDKLNLRQPERLGGLGR